MRGITRQRGNNSPKGPFSFYLVPEGLKNAMNIAYFSTPKFSCPLNIFIIKILWYDEKNINLLNIKMFVNIYNDTLVMKYKFDKY